MIANSAVLLGYALRAYGREFYDCPDEINFLGSLPIMPSVKDQQRRFSLGISIFINIGSKSFKYLSSKRSYTNNIEYYSNKSFQYNQW